MNKFMYIMRESVLARFLIPAGIIFIVVGIIFFFAINNSQNYVETTSTISNVTLVEDAYTDTDGNRVEATYDIEVKYVVDGQEYKSTLPGMGKRNIGEKMKIYYNPDDPSQITQSKSLIIPIVMVVGGIASLVGGIISAKNAINRYKKMKEQEKGWANE